MSGKKALRASFTVELSLLMTLLLPLLTGLIYLGFYMHDRAFLAGAALETACTAGLCPEEASEGQLEKKRQQLIRGRLLAVREPGGAAALKKDSVTVTATGTFRVPGMLRPLFGAAELPVSQRAQLGLESPRKTVNKIHGIRKMLNQRQG